MANPTVIYIIIRCLNSVAPRVDRDVWLIRFVNAHTQYRNDHLKPMFSMTHCDMWNQIRINRPMWRLFHLSTPPIRADYAMFCTLCMFPVINAFSDVIRNHGVKSYDLGLLFAISERTRV